MSNWNGFDQPDETPLFEPEYGTEFLSTSPGAQPFAGYDEEVFSESEFVEVDAEVGRNLERTVEDDIREAIAYVENAKNLPLSSSVMISRDDLLQILEDALQHVPDEIREARFVLNDRDALRADAEAQAAQLLEQVRVEAARLVDQTEIVRQAKMRAQKIESEARAKGRHILNNTNEFINSNLENLENALEKLAHITRNGRNNLISKTPPSVLDEPAASSETADLFFNPDDE